MAVTVRIPTVLRHVTDGRDQVEATGTTVAEVLDAVGREHTGFLERITVSPGELRPFVNVYVNGDDIRLADGIRTPVREGDEISIIPSIAGGR